MTANEEHREQKLEKAARYIDGEPVELDGEEQQIVEEYRDDEEAIRPRLEVKMSPWVARKARKKIHALVRNLPKRLLRALIIGLIVALAFVIVLLAYRYYKHGSFVRGRRRGSDTPWGLIRAETAPPRVFAKPTAAVFPG